jgi:hypothetical protein
MAAPHPRRATRWWTPRRTSLTVASAAIASVLMAGCFNNPPTDLARGESTPNARGSAPATAPPSAPDPSTAPTTSLLTLPTPTRSARPSPSSAKPLVTPTVVRTPKKGVSLWSSFGGAGEALRDVKASWFYDWSPDGAADLAPAGVEFVPMIWGAGAVNMATLNRAKAHGTVLLGFNEPDLAGQANMTVELALDLWPQLMATGMRLGSPAPAWGADQPGGWLDRFMNGARARGYRVDFITVHWYGSYFGPAATDHLRSYLQAVYDRFRLPIWLTEYALINFSGSPMFPSQEQQAQFVRSSTAMMAGLSFVERYAWFALPSAKPGDTGLYLDGRTPTMAGAAYRAAEAA